MIGTIVNTCTILLGSLLGSVLKKGIKQEYQSALYTAMGLAATGLGVNAIVQNMPDSKCPVLFIASLATQDFIICCITASTCQRNLMVYSSITRSE